MRRGPAHGRSLDPPPTYIFLSPRQMLTLHLAAAPVRPVRGHAARRTATRPAPTHLAPRQPRLPVRAAAGAADDDDSDVPSTAREAIDAGIARLEAGDADASLALFTRALTLPGRGLKRFR